MQKRIKGWVGNRFDTKLISMSITTEHLDCPDKWTVSCPQLGWTCKELGLDSSVDISRAKSAAVLLLKQTLYSMVDSVEKVA